MEKQIINKPVLLRHTIDASIEEIQLAASNSKYVQLPTGFEKIDDCLLGLHKGDLVVIGGRASMGKTAFAISLAANVCSKNIPVLYFSLHESQSALTYKIIANRLKVNLTKLRNGQLNENDWRQIDNHINELQENFPFYIHDKAFIDIEEIKNVTMQAVESNQVKLIVVDSLRMIENDKDFIYSRDDKMADTIVQLKKLAKTADIPIIVTSNINKTKHYLNPFITQPYDGIPQISQMQDGDAIENNADVIILIYRPEEDNITHDEFGNDMHGVGFISIAKNSMGTKAEIQLNFSGEYARFNDYKIPEDQFLNNESFDNDITDNIPELPQSVF